MSGRTKQRQSTAAAEKGTEKGRIVGERRITRAEPAPPYWPLPPSQILTPSTTAAPTLTKWRGLSESDKIVP